MKQGGYCVKEKTLELKKIIKVIKINHILIYLFTMLSFWLAY